VHPAPQLIAAGEDTIEPRPLPVLLTVIVLSSPIASVSTALLFEVSVSLVEAGRAIVAVLLTVPEPEPAITVALSVKVAVALTGRFTVVLMPPLPDTAPQMPPLAPTHDHVAFAAS